MFFYVEWSKSYDCRWPPPQKSTFVVAMNRVDVVDAVVDLVDVDLDADLVDVDLDVDLVDVDFEVDLVLALPAVFKVLGPRVH